MMHHSCAAVTITSNEYMTQTTDIRHCARAKRPLAGVRNQLSQTGPGAKIIGVGRVELLEGYTRDQNFQILKFAQKAHSR